MRRRAADGPWQRLPELRGEKQLKREDGGGKESLDVGIKRASVLNVNLLVGHVVVIGSISAGL